MKTTIDLPGATFRRAQAMAATRGEMGNRIKEQQLDLFADRTSTRFFRTNELRLLVTSFAYVLVEGFRRGDTP